MPEQLKIVIDADVNGAIAGVQNLSRVISSDFTKATNSAITAASNLSSEVAASVQKINNSLSGLKVTSLDVNVDTSGIDASIKSIQSKFANLVDPQINVFANTTKAESQIKELLGELSSLKSSEVFIRANDAQALSAINQIETELNSILDKQIKINVNAIGITDTTQRISALEKSLLNLEALKVTPGISSTQLELFETNIQRVKAEIASLKTQALVVPIGVDIAQAQTSVNILSESIETLRARAEAKKIFITTETDITKIAAYNKEIQNLETRVRQLQNVGKRGFELFVVPNQVISSVRNLSTQVAAFGGGVRTFIPPAISNFKQLPSAISPVITQLKSLEAQSIASGAATSNAFTKAFSGIRQLAFILPGIGIAGIFNLAFQGISSLTDGFFEAAFGASKLDKALNSASESVDVDAVKTIGLVKALQSGTLTTDEFRKVKAQVIAQAPEFQKSFDGDKIKVKESDDALTKYIEKLTATVRVTAALGIVNETLAKSIKAIVKGEDFSFGEALSSFFQSGLSPLGALEKTAEKSTANVQKAFESLKPENITKLLDDTFKKLGISFHDLVDVTGDGGKALKAQLDKIKADFEKFQTEIISKARLFTKEFGDAFVVPNLEESFFKTKQELFKQSAKLLSDVKAFIGGDQSALKIKIPVIATTETKLNADDLKKFLRGEIPESDIRTIKIRIPVVTDADFKIAEDLAQEFKLSKDELEKKVEGFMKSFVPKEFQPIEIGVPVDLTIPTKLQADQLDKLLEGFSKLGTIGFKAFEKIDFTKFNDGLKEGNATLERMLALANTLAQSIGNGLSNAFDSVFDAVLQGKSVFKALGQAIQSLVIETIKAIVKMLILRAVTAAIFPGAGNAAGTGGLGKLIGGIGRGGQANLGFGSIGSSPFQNVLTVNVNGQISGDVIRLAGQRAANSAGRFG